MVLTLMWKTGVSINVWVCPTQRKNHISKETHREDTGWRPDWITSLNGLIVKEFSEWCCDFLREIKHMLFLFWIFLQWPSQLQYVVLVSKFVGWMQGFCRPRFWAQEGNHRASIHLSLRTPQIHESQGLNLRPYVSQPVYYRRKVKSFPQ